MIKTTNQCPLCCALRTQLGHRSTSVLYPRSRHSPLLDCINVGNDLNSAVYQNIRRAVHEEPFRYLLEAPITHPVPRPFGSQPEPLLNFRVIASGHVSRAGP